MNVKSLATAGAIAALSLGSASGAFAQAAPTVTHGAPIAGVCVFSAEGAVSDSTVGKYINTRMQQIIAQVNAELNTEKTGIDNDAKALEGQRASLDQATLQKRVNDLNTRAANLQRKAQLRDREVGATEQKAVGRVLQEMQPLLATAYQSKSCSLLLNGQAVTWANPSMDLTDAVVAQLNTKLTQFAFDRERLDQAAAGGQAAPAKK